ncbi:MAG TPA: hypothetical protein VGL53_01320 [Bryobacteraceae bacterium]
MVTIKTTATIPRVNASRMQESDVPTESLDDENGNRKQCGHPFDPHIITAYDASDFSKAGEMRCPVENCSCFSTISFNMKEE